MELKEVVFKLSEASGLGCINEASLIAQNMINNYCPVTKLSGLGFYSFLDNKKEHTVMLEAHIDEVGMIVTNVDDKGFATVAACGGIDVRNLPASEVTIHSKQKYPAVFVSTPPHLAKGNSVPDNIGEIKLDTGLGTKAKDIIHEGDFVTFNIKPKTLLGSRITGKAFDDRLSCAVLIELAKRLCDKALPVNVMFVFNDGEELGLRGARTSAFSLSCNEAVCLDVSFGEAPNIRADKCFKLGGGVMIGFSPVLNKAAVKKLERIANENDISYQCEVMADTTGTNADVISVTKEGIPTSLLSIPIRNMHTGVEVADMSDIEKTVLLLEKYILAGGISNEKIS